MKTILRSVILVFSLAVCLQTNVKAQKVYIPDANFRAWLNINYASCMVGDSIDPACPEVLNATWISINYKGIKNLTGIEVFVNLTYLYCSSNQLTNLPTLPPLLTYFDCSFNNLTSMPNWLPPITHLDFSYNQIKKIPFLPSTLKNLLCYNNQLAFLPTLPSTLKILYCDSNQLTFLPVLPNSLNALFCSFNPIILLPDLNNVTFLGFDNTLVKCLPNYGVVTWSSPLITSIPLCDNDINIDVRPNPFVGELNITLDKDYTGEFEVYNSIGEIIISEKLQSRIISLNTINWNAGLYYLKFETNNGVVVKKVVKR
jgi:hypothetical protein